jgi:hypothetical protein
MAKIVLSLLAAFLATIVAAGFTYRATASTGTAPAVQPWALNKMEFVAWNDERWTAWIRDGAFEQLPQNNQKWSRHLNPSLAFTDWDGEAWQAKIDGEEFLLAYRGDWNGPIERASAMRYRDWSGENEMRTVAQLRR